MANAFTPTDDRAQELDGHFEDHVVGGEAEDDYDVAVAYHGEDIDEIEAAVDGVEHHETFEMPPLGKLAAFNYVDE